MTATINTETTPRYEAKLLAQYSWPIILASILQYSIPVASVFTVGHLGTIELGAVSLGTMTANITGYAVYQGLATSLDTLCAQAYGSGHKRLVGLHCQRMVILLWAVTFPIGLVWLFSRQILGSMVPKQETVELAALYLRILMIGAPGWAAFESGKRFVQAQGLFRANLYVLLVLAPLNAFLHWLFVWEFAWGFVGAPLAVAITNALLPISLALYVRFIDGRVCWNGLSYAAFHDWSPMIRLALPGFLMIEAEWMAFEILTLSASYLDSTHLAAQSVVMTMASLATQIPLPLAIAASTRVANLIGAGSSAGAKLSAKVAILAAILVGVFGTCVFASLKNYIPFLFTTDAEVAQLITGTLPVIAGFQMFDALSNMCNGLLRGIGRQDVGGYVALLCFYIVRTPPIYRRLCLAYVTQIGLPIALVTCFRLHWDLWGLWAGPCLAAAL